MLLQDGPLTRFGAESALAILRSAGACGPSIYHCRFHSHRCFADPEIAGKVLLIAVSRFREFCGGFVLIVLRRGIHFAEVGRSGRRGAVRGGKHAEYLVLYDVKSACTGLQKAWSTCSLPDLDYLVSVTYVRYGYDLREAF